METMSDKIFEKLAERADSTRQIVAAYPDIRFSLVDNEGNKNKTLYINDPGKDSDAYVLTERGYRAFLDTLRIPVPYAKRMPDGLLLDNVNYWLRAKENATFSALVTDGKIRALMNPDHTYVPTLAVVEAMRRVAPSDWNITESLIDDAQVKIAFTLDREVEVGVGDISTAGLSLVHSDSWAVAPRFDSYLLRLECLNGQVSPVGGRKFRVSGHTTAEIEQQVEEFTLLALEQLDDMLAGYKRLSEEEVGSAVQLIQKICRENNLPRKVQEALLAALGSESFIASIGGRVNTMYDVLNVLTWVGTHNTELSVEHRLHLQEIAGSMSITGKTRCVTCGSSVE